MPDYKWKNCCDAHDICYCSGGSESDREKCDRKFKRCLRNWGPEWADTAYFFVKHFGRSHFNYRTRHNDLPMTTTSSDSKFKAKLVSVKYSGDDIQFRVEILATPRGYGNPVQNHYERNRDFNNGRDLSINRNILNQPYQNNLINSPYA